MKRVKLSTGIEVDVLEVGIGGRNTASEVPTFVALARTGPNAPMMTVALDGAVEVQREDPAKTADRIIFALLKALDCSDAWSKARVEPNLMRVTVLRELQR